MRINLLGVDFVWGKDALAHKPQEENPIQAKGGERKSQPDWEGTLFGQSHSLQGDMILEPEINTKYIDIIEYLAAWDSDFSQAIENRASLANTDFYIEFEDEVGDQEAEDMIKHLSVVTKKWYNFGEGLHSLSGDLLAQIRIGGALSGEAVLKEDLTGIKNIVKVNPKNIRFIPNEERTEYLPAQKVTGLNIGGNNIAGDVIHLNPQTYKYFALRRYKDSPYGIPPLLSALEPADIKADQVKNLKFVMRKFGLMGFLEVLMNKPTQKQTESSADYQKRAEDYLVAATSQLEKGLDNGIIAGYTGTHEFKYQDVKPTGSGMKDTYDINDRNLITGLKEAPQMMGRTSSTTETFGRVVLAKYGEQLTDEQGLLSAFWVEMFKLELILAGFRNGGLVKDVIYDAPMVGDRVREEDAMSKRIDNSNKLYDAGYLSQQEAANRLNIDEPDQDEPRVPRSPTGESNAKEGEDPTDPKTTEANKATLDLHREIFFSGSPDVRQEIIDKYRKDLGSGEEFNYITDGLCSCGDNETVIALSDHWRIVASKLPAPVEGYKLVDVEWEDGEVSIGCRLINGDTLISEKLDVSTDSIASLQIINTDALESLIKQAPKKKKKKSTKRQYSLNLRKSSTK